MNFNERRKKNTATGDRLWQRNEPTLSINAI
jgi:hypothetical protein